MHHAMVCKQIKLKLNNLHANHAYKKLVNIKNVYYAKILDYLKK
jgi:hypothetical protein